MANVETVGGPVATVGLGQVLMHEHVFTIGTEIRENYPGYPDPLDEEHRVADAVEKGDVLRRATLAEYAHDQPEGTAK